MAFNSAYALTQRNQLEKTYYEKILSFLTYHPFPKENFLLRFIELCFVISIAISSRIHCFLSYLES